jgi:hypothetical protein
VNPRFFRLPRDAQQESSDRLRKSTRVNTAAVLGINAEQRDF